MGGDATRQALIGAVVIIDRAVNKHREELEAMPIDHEVAEIDKQDAKITAAWRASAAGARSCGRQCCSRWH